MRKLVYFIIFCIGLLMGCKREIGPTANTEKPVKKTITDKLVIDSFIIYSYVSNIESGNKFYSSKNGIITKLGCQMRSKGTFIVSLWDFYAATLISATNVSVTDTTSFFYNPISPVSITANTRYVISVFIPGARLYSIYYKKPSIDGPSIYPFTSGSITFEDYRQRLGVSTSSFPTSAGVGQWAILGVADLQFEYPE